MVTRERGNVAEAMAADRPAKQAVREEWMSALGGYVPHAPLGETLYATLCGAAATDVRMVIDRGYLQLEENGAVAEAQSSRVIAIERDPIQAGLLKNEFPGLYVIASSVEDVLKGDHEIRYPVGMHLQVPRASVLNLDFNGNLAFKTHPSKGIICTTIELVRKAAIAHAQEPIREPWGLFLTVRGSATWERDIDAHIARALEVGRELSAGFSDATELVESEFLSTFASGNGRPLGTLPTATQQRTIVAYVAFRVLQVASAVGWQATCVKARYYGGETHETAPMCTWIFDFAWSTKAHTGDPAVLRASLDTALADASYLDADGVHRSFYGDD